MCLWCSLPSVGNEPEEIGIIGAAFFIVQRKILCFKPDLVPIDVVPLYVIIFVLPKNPPTKKIDSLQSCVLMRSFVIDMLKSKPRSPDSSRNIITYLPPFNIHL